VRAAAGVAPEQGDGDQAARRRGAQPLAQVPDDPGSNRIRAVDAVTQRRLPWIAYPRAEPRGRPAELTRGREPW
jgi:hypothetical protein